MKVQAGHLDRYIDANAAELIDRACRLDIETVSALMSDMRVTGVVGDTVELQITIPRLEGYLAVHIGGLPYAAEFQALADDVKQDYYHRVAEDLASYRTSDGTLRVPFALHFVSATRAVERP